MTESENTRLVQQVYQTFQTGDFDTLVRSLDPDIEWRLPEMEHVPFGGTWRGHDGVRQFMRHVAESQEVVEFRPEQFISQGNQVVVLGRFVMRVKATGRESASEWAQVWTIDGGKVTRFREYVDTDTVRRAHAPA